MKTMSQQGTPPLSTLQSANTVACPPSSSPSLSSSTKQQSKAILRAALQKANSAVLCDSTNDVVGAMDAYSEAITLLNRVLVTAERENDRKRLQEIHDSYSERLRLLGALSPKSEDEELYETFREDSSPCKISMPAEEAKENPWPVQTTQKTFSRSHRRFNSLHRVTSSSSFESTMSAYDARSPDSPYRSDYDLPSNTSSDPIFTPPHSARSTQWMADSSPPHTYGLTRLVSATKIGQHSTKTLVPASPQTSRSTPVNTRVAMSHDITQRPGFPDEDMPAYPPSPADPSTVKDQKSILPQKISKTIAFSLRHAGKGKDTLAIENENLTETSHRLSANSIVSVSSMASSTESETFGAEPMMRMNNHHQPPMALPSLRSAKLEEEGYTYTAQRVSPNERSSSKSGKETPLSTISRKTSMRARTSSLPKQLFLPRAKTPMITHLNGTNGTNGINNTSSEMVSKPFQPMSSSASVSETSIPQEDHDPTAMRRALTQPMSSTKDSSESSSPALRPAIHPQTSSIGSVHRKGSRLSRSSMEGASRKDKNASHFGSLMKEIITPHTSAAEVPSDYFSKFTYLSSQHSKEESQARYEECVGHLFMDGSMEDPLLETSRQLRPIFLLEQSMVQGGYITSRLYIPKNLWYQSNIKLASMDVKAAACESLYSDLVHFEKWKQLDDISGSMKMLDGLLLALQSLQTNLSKKLKRDSMISSSLHGSTGGISSNSHLPSTNGKDMPGSAGMNTFISVNDTSSKKAQAFLSWGTKLTKSVERMNAFSLTKAEDQYRNYIDSLQKLFAKVHILEQWMDHYVKQARVEDASSCSITFHRLNEICILMNVVIGGFVVRDIAVLLGKWLKRGGSWVNE
ncbi:hypothetical protein BDF14DRAFT_1886777 [Spinellus fusiger]|nr:hypothetical protein BDF14DRAFT_1886777 [Spinellus fusiger]